MDTTILVADDHKIMRDGLRSLLERLPGIKVVAEAENGRIAVQLTERLRPKVVIMDVSMPDLNGIEATRQILSEFPETKVIALSMHSDRRFVIGMFKAGVCGYLLKDCAFEELSHAIDAVKANQIYLSPRITGTVIKDYMSYLSLGDSSEASVLTAREREVLQLIAEGKKTKEIANHLHVSIKTIETHRRQIMEKLKLHSVAELTKLALKEGITSFEN